MAKDCPNKEANLPNCTCTYSCDKRGICCDCVQNHVRSRQIPGCFFPPAAEATYDRSFEAFAKAWNL